MTNRTLTRIRGLQVGHWTDAQGQTGCTVVLCPPEGCVASASFLGPAPGTREGVLLGADKRVEVVHALVLTGGSAFGLAAADGVVRLLEERGIGLPTPTLPVPIVPAAVIYDLLLGDARARPTAESGYQAAQSASSEPVEEGRVGAGTGASAGKYLGPVPTGLGSALARHEDIRVGALAVVNPVGDVYDLDGQLRAGHGKPDAFLQATLSFGSTTLIAVGVEAPLTKAEAQQLAHTAQGAIGRVIRPSHTPWDGDVAFVLSTGQGPPTPLPTLCALVQQAVVDAIIRTT